jgi:hypothetical protein
MYLNGKCINEFKEYEECYNKMIKNGVNKIIKLSFVMLMGLLVYSCGNKDKIKLEAITECFYPDSPKDKAPLWVCGAEVEGIEVAAVGYSEKSNAGLNFMQQQALANARVLLAQRFKVNIESSVGEFIESQKKYDDESKMKETVKNVASLVSKQITDESVSGAKIYRTQISPTGGMFVLIGLEKATYDLNVKNSLEKEKIKIQNMLNDSYKNDGSTKNTNENTTKEMDDTEKLKSLEKIVNETKKQ